MKRLGAPGPRTRLVLADTLAVAALIGLYLVAFNAVHGLWPHLWILGLYMSGLLSRGHVCRLALAKLRRDQVDEDQRRAVEWLRDEFAAKFGPRP